MGELFEPYTDEEWQERLQRAVAETLRKQVRRRAEREEHQRRRDAGLEARHRRKLARNAAREE